MHNTPAAYVVLRHDGIDRPHFDWMIEASPGGGLMTWRCGRWPLVQGDRIERIADHRRAYLQHEGEVAGGRGHVRRIESGSATLSEERGEWRIVLEVVDVLAERERLEESGAADGMVRRARIVLREAGESKWAVESVRRSEP